MKPRAKPSVSIVGGGFAGVACANALPADLFSVTLIDEKANFEFLPNIHELLSGVKKPRQLRIPLNALMRSLGHRFVRGTVSAIDPSARSVRIMDRRIESDYLVVALGSADATFGVNGVENNSLGFKSVDQCDAIRQRLMALSKGADAPRVVIVGGGLEGIEALGEILRAYHGIHIDIVEAQERLLPAMQSSVSKHIESLSTQHKVNVLVANPVAKITPKSVVLQNGQRLRSDLTIWTGGPRPPDLLAASGLAQASQWAGVDAYLEHKEYEGVYIAGDAAQTEPVITKQAYHALDMGRCVAKNIQRREAGRKGRIYKPAPKPTLLAFGDLDTVLISDRGSLCGPALAAGKEAVFAGVMTQIDKRSADKRLSAAFERGKAANQKLLWPRLQSWSSLQRQARFKRLK